MNFLNLYQIIWFIPNLYKFISNFFKFISSWYACPTNYFNILRHWMRLSCVFQQYIQVWRPILQKDIKKDSSCDVVQIGQDDGQVNPSFSILVHFRKHSFELIPTCTNHKVTCVQTAHRISTYPLSMYWDLHCCGPVSRQRRATRSGAFAALRNACCAVPHPWCSHPTCQW